MSPGEQGAPPITPADQPEQKGADCVDPARLAEENLRVDVFSSPP